MLVSNVNLMEELCDNGSQGRDVSKAPPTDSLTHVSETPKLKAGRCLCCHFDSPCGHFGLSEAGLTSSCVYFESFFGS